MEFLKAVGQRAKQERAAEQSQEDKRDEEDHPMFDLIHGVPGAGKSKLIGWLCSFFQEVLGWWHGVQFVCLAF